MQHKDSDIRPKNVTRIPGESLTFSPSLIVWLVHWISAILVVFLLATSLVSGLGLTTRLFPSAWMDWHLSSGITLCVVTILRV